MLKQARRAFLANYWVLQIHKISRHGLMLMNCIVAFRYLLSLLILPPYQSQPFHFLSQSVNDIFPFLYSARISDLNTQRSTKSSFCWISPGWLLEQNQRILMVLDCAACLKCTAVLLMCAVIYPTLLKRNLCVTVCVRVCLCLCVVLWQILTHGHTLSLHDTHKTQHSLKTDQCFL